VTETGDERKRNQQDYVLRTVEERGVRLIRLWFTDVLGRHKSVAISPAELETVFDEGLQFDGSAIDGFSRIQESDVLARPDASTFELLPWASPDEPSGTVFCDIVNLDGTPFEGDPRQVLRRNLERAREEGYEMFCAPEVEFFYLAQNTGTPVPLALNLETYQAAVNGSPLDLTYMEYELLKFLASHPGKVFTRETLLSRVWGYDYYGGARTVDVHIRRLRAKLGEEHAGLIHTVRSVGYRFGQSRWGV